MRLILHNEIRLTVARWVAYCEALDRKRVAALHRERAVCDRYCASYATRLRLSVVVAQNQMTTIYGHVAVVHSICKQLVAVRRAGSRAGENQRVTVLHDDVICVLHRLKADVASRHNVAVRRLAAVTKGHGLVRARGVARKTL